MRQLSIYLKREEYIGVEKIQAQVGDRERELTETEKERKREKEQAFGGPLNHSCGGSPSELPLANHLALSDSGPCPQEDFNSR